jgi:hypothetical protein
MNAFKFSSRGVACAARVKGGEGGWPLWMPVRGMGRIPCQLAWLVAGLWGGRWSGGRAGWLAGGRPAGPWAGGRPGGQADVVTLHVPSSESTSGMIGRRELSLMKPHAHLINNARGDVVDLDALAEVQPASRPLPLPLPLPCPALPCPVVRCAALPRRACS